PAESMEARLIALRLSLRLGERRKAAEELAQARLLADRVSLFWQTMIDGYAAHPLFYPKQQERQAALLRLDSAMHTLQAMGVIDAWLELALIAAALAASLRQPDASQRYARIIDRAQQQSAL